MRAEDIEEIYPLSSLQQGILFHSLESPGTGVYLQQVTCTLTGDLDWLAFQAAWQRVVDRHPPLRTAFVYEGVERPLQVVCRRVQVPFDRRDLRGLTPCEQRERITEFLLANQGRGFKLTDAPLMRVALFQTAAEAHELVWSHHHLVLDGWSVGLVLRELFECYEAFAGGRSPELAQPPWYRDYIAWLSRQDLAAAEAFWRRELAGFTAATRLGVDHAASARAEREVSGAELESRLTTAHMERLSATARRHQITLNTLVQGAWALLLSRYSGEDDVVFGVVSSGRPPGLSGAERMVGLFINTLPARIKVLPDEPLLSWLRKLHLHQAELRQYEHSPLQQVKAWSEVPRSEPLFESLLDFISYPEASSRSSGRVRIARFHFSERTNYPLALIAAPGKELLLRAYYDAKRFDAATIGRILAQLETLLIELTGEPERPLESLDLLSESERWQILAWSSIRMAVSSGGCIHELFATHASREPESIAVVCGNERLHYGELDRHANRLAHHLRARGVGPETCVGVCMERSLDLVVALLAILKAGAAYVPLDPRYPSQRLAYLLEDSRVPILLTQEALLSRLPQGDYERLCLNTARDLIEHQPEEAPALTIDPDNAAYVIYTSGSTGRPKGVVVSHANVVRLFHSTWQWFQFGPHDVWTLFHSYAFDFSVWEIWGALLYGGRLVIVPFEISRSPEAFHRLLCHQRVTVLNQTPSAFYPLIEADLAAEEGDLALRLVVFGGEVLDFQRLRPWFERHGEDRPQLVNMYGITETTVHVTYRLVRATEAGRRARSAIGVRIPDLETYVLDRRGRMMPTGAPGEVYVGGAGLARGYLRRPDLTAERFLPCPFGEQPGARLYRTGDLACFRPDGELEYIGRVDHQVKVRGFRIELGEIEVALASHPEVREVVVTAQQGESPADRLVAYFVPRQDPPPNLTELRSFLSEMLPEHMVPAVFVQLVALPLTPGGKVDLRALPAAERHRSGRTYASPRTRVEKLIAEVWSAVLGVERVGINDEFFELGGDSILSIQILSRLRRAGLEMSPVDLFEHPKLSDFAAVAETVRTRRIDQGPVTGPVPLTPIQHWFFASDPVDPHHFNQALLLEVQHPVDISCWSVALVRLLAHHDSLRLRFMRTDVGWSQWLAAPGDETPFFVVDLSSLPGERRCGALETASAVLQTSLNLTAGPLLRAALFRCGEGEPDRFLLIIHHLAVDGVSWRALLEDLWTALDALVRGEEISLPAKTTSFKTWAEGLAAHARSRELAEERAHWLMVGRAEALPPLPGVEASDGGNSSPACTRAEALSPEETRSLLQQVPAVYRTHVNDVLLTALVESFAGLTGRRRLLLDLEGHGREPWFDAAIDLSRTVGWLTTVFPVLLDLEGVTDPGAALKASKEQMRAIPRRGIGYGVLRYLGGDEELAALPHAEVSFNYLGQLDQALPASIPFRPAGEAVGPLCSPRQSPRYRLEVVAQVLGGCLQTSWTAAAGSGLSEACLDELARGFSRSLRRLIDHCRSPLVEVYTPSDFLSAHLTQQQVDRLAARFGGMRARIEDVYPLSPMQSGMLFHSLYEPESGFYVQHLVCELIGDFDADAFVRAWRHLFARHPILRTSFVWEELDEPLQVVVAEVEVPLEQLDWRGLSDEEVEHRIASRLAADRRQAFDLSQAPLMRLLLARTGERTHRLIWTYHHILLDGWSRASLIQQLIAAYEATRGGEEPELGPHTPFRRYIDWLRGQDPSAARDFWLRQLAGADPVELEGRESETGGTQHSDEEARLSATITAGLQALARGHRITLSILLQGVWALFLSRYTSREDVVFGVIVSGRNGPLPGIETVIGLLMNVQPMRARVRRQQRLLPWLKELQERQAQAHCHEHVPLTTLQSWLGTGGQGLFDTIFVFENFPVTGSSARRRSSTLEIRRPRGAGAVNYPLALVVEPESELLLRIRHDVYRFDAAVVRSMLRTYESFLEAVLADPGCELGELLAIAARPNEVVQSFNEAIDDF